MNAAGSELAALCEALQALESELHHPGTHCSRARLKQLLHPDFHEIGRSGQAYDRALVLDWLARQQVLPHVVSDAYVLACPAPETALLHYRSVLRTVGQAPQYTLRMSLWLRTAVGWQLRYHQGTPAARGW